MKINFKIFYLTVILIILSFSVIAENVKLVIENNQQVQKIKEENFFSKFVNWFKKIFVIKEVKIQSSHVVCRTPISALPEVTQNAVNSQAKNICLGGLIAIDGPPILGNIDGLPIIDPVNKYQDDIIGQVVNRNLECFVPCSNHYANEIKTCFDFSNPGAPFKLNANPIC